MHVQSTKRVIFYIFTCQIIFYSIYFCIGSIVFAIKGLEDFDGTIPFNFRQWVEFQHCCNYTSEEIVNTVSMLVTYPLTGAALGAYIPEWVWDYSITTSILHIALSCLVMLDFATNWTWWICLGVSLLMMTGCGEGVLALRRFRNKSRLVVPEPQSELKSYLYR